MIKDILHKKTQTQIVLDRLNETGEIDNGYCLDRAPRRITRLGAIICDLSKDGYIFNREYIKDKEGNKTRNFRYTLISKPL